MSFNNNFVNTDELENQKVISEQVKKLTFGKSFKALVLTLGCQQNEADSEVIRGILKSLGYFITYDDKDADVIIINTCAVREHAESRALSIIGRYKHNKIKNPDMILGVCGCMTSQSHRTEQIKHSYPYVDFVFGTGSAYRLPEFILNVLSGGKRMFLTELERPQIAEGLPVVRESGYRAWVSIMYGCNNFCTYCIVPYVRGRERSRKPEDILREVKSLVDDGYRDITLLGQNVNSYGKDLDGTSTVAYLVNEISKMDGDFYLHLMTSHPKDASCEMIEAVTSSKKSRGGFHLPLQSGSDEILKRMNRKYDTERYLSIINGLRSKNKDIVLTTDIIVGFPGETEEDFQKTLDILEKIKFDSIFAFIFSPRKGTPAYDMENQISDEIKHERFDRLNKLQNSISLEKNLSYVGKAVRVLVDGKSKNNESTYSSRTSGNKIVHFESDKDYTGQFINVKITRADTFALYGEI